MLPPSLLKNVECAQRTVTSEVGRQGHSIATTVDSLMNADHDDGSCPFESPMNRFETVQHLDECIEDSGQVPLERSPSDLRASSVSKRPVQPRSMPPLRTPTRSPSSICSRVRFLLELQCVHQRQRNDVHSANEHRSMPASFAEHRTEVASISRCHGSHASLLVRLPISPLALARAVPHRLAPRAHASRLLRRAPRRCAPGPHHALGHERKQLVVIQP